MWRKVREYWLLTDVSRSILLVVLLLALVANVGFMVYWSLDPKSLPVSELAAEKAARYGHEVVTGTTMTSTLIGVAETLLDKPGGYLSNDILPPGVIMDNMPSWEFGAVQQVRDLADAMRIHMSRSQTQSREDPDLAEAAPLFQFSNDEWIFPSTESVYREGVEALERYLRRLGDQNEADAQFYARADNLRQWLTDVQARLGNHATALAASVGERRIDAALAGDPSATQSTPRPRILNERTPWLEIDNVFYEARGACWALIQFLRAAEVDFASVLENKNATASLQNVIRYLEPTQDFVWSPVILNGHGFGFTANHSLVMGSYISRANAAIIELRTLLAEG